MKDIDCEHVPECDPIQDDGCQERIWTWKEYCSNRELFEKEAPEVETVIEQPQVHVPVDTSGGVYDAFLCLGWLLALFGAGFLVVGVLTWVRNRV